MILELREKYKSRYNDLAWCFDTGRSLVMWTIGSTFQLVVFSPILDSKYIPYYLYIVD